MSAAYFALKILEKLPKNPEPVREDLGTYAVRARVPSDYPLWAIEETYRGQDAAMVRSRELRQTFTTVEITRVTKTVEQV